jgi:hypothetical protein
LLSGLQGYEQAKYYRQAGIGTAATDVLRQSLNLPTSYEVARRRRGITGLNPENVQVVERGQNW